LVILNVRFVIEAIAIGGARQVRRLGSGDQPTNAEDYHK
jgi:hypothetical protein